MRLEGLMRVSVAVLVLLGLAVTSPASAQTGSKIVAGEQVIVTRSTSGEELRGQLVDLSPDSLGLLVNGSRIDVPLENVLRIETRHDSVKNGAAIGAALMGGIAVLGCAQTSSGSWCAYGLTTNTLLGAAIGAGIDALHKGRSPIYIKAAPSGGALQVRLRF
jgi:hypothetical protein